MASPAIRGMSLVLDRSVVTAVWPDHWWRSDWRSPSATIRFSRFLLSRPPECEEIRSLDRRIAACGSGRYRPAFSRCRAPLAEADAETRGRTPSPDRDARDRRRGFPLPAEPARIRTAQAEGRGRLPEAGSGSLLHLAAA